VRTIMVILGFVLVVVGIVWVLQGIGTLKGSFMTNQTFWTWMGVLAMLVGIPVITQGLRRTRS
jgi:hypothetical protein